MYRKVLKDNNKKNGYPQNHIGKPLGIIDRNGDELHVGDKVIVYKASNEKHVKHTNVIDRYGIILWNSSQECYQIHLLDTLWYGTDEYNSNSYGKVYPICMKNGNKENIEILR